MTQGTADERAALGLAALELVVSNGVAQIRLARPDVLNAFDDAMLEEFAAVWAHLRRSDDVRAVIVTGSGEKAFCVGYDRQQFDTVQDGLIRHQSPFVRADVGELLGPKHNGMWKPVIAAVNGIACGGAFYLLGESDIIIAAEHATFFDPHVTFGMPAIYEPLHLLQRLPFGELLRMTLLGSAERLSAARALEIGFVSEVVPAAELDAAAAWVAQVIADAPPLAVQASLRAMWLGSAMTRTQALAAAPAFVGAGTDAAELAAGQSRFASGDRRPWRMR